MLKISKMSAKIFPFITEYWKLDGGSCFGVTPKTIWSKLVTPDELNLIDIASRCLYIESGESKIVIDTGIGNKLGEDFYKYFYRSQIKPVADCILELGINPSEITDVIFTHLHWDHVGGATFVNSNGEVELTFPNATHWCSKSGYLWSQNHSPREKKAFFESDITPLAEKGKLHFIENDLCFDEHIFLGIYDGHTIGQLIPIIQTEKGKVVFAGDFIPSKAHIPVTSVPSQDINPLITMTEKEQFLKEALKKEYTIIFQHDATNECCKLVQTEKGIVGAESFTWNNK